MWSLTANAGDFGLIPQAVGLAAYDWAVSLDETLFTVIANQGIDLVARLLDTKHLSMLHYRGLATGHWMESSTMSET